MHHRPRRACELMTPAAALHVEKPWRADLRWKRWPVNTRFMARYVLAKIERALASDKSIIGASGRILDPIVRPMEDLALRIAMNRDRRPAARVKG